MGMDSVATSQQGKPSCSEQSKDITELVKEDLTLRKQMGIRKYGIPLMSHNGRNPLIDAYQEAMDLCLYLRQAVDESLPQEPTETTAASRFFADLRTLGMVQEQDRWMIEYLFNRHMAQAGLQQPQR